MSDSGTLQSEVPSLAINAFQQFAIARQRVDSVFALLAADAESIREVVCLKGISEATTILDEVERELSQWYGDRRLAV